MEIYSVDKSNISDFGFLFNEDARKGIEADTNSGIVVKHEGRHAGGLYGEFVSPSEFAVLSLYVLPENRRQGVGSFMIDTLCEVLGNRDTNITFRFVAVGEDGRALADFLEAKGFDDFIDADNEIYYTTIEKIKDIKLSVKTKKLVYKPLYEIPSYKLNDLVSNTKGFLPVPMDGFDSKSVIKELSMCIYNEDKLSGYAVCEKVDDNNVMLSCLYVKKGVASIALAGLLGTLVNKIQSTYSEKTGILVPCINDVSKRLVEMLFEEEDVEMVAANYTKRITAARDNTNQPLYQFLEDERQYLYGDDEEGEYLTEAPPVAWL